MQSKSPKKLILILLFIVLPAIALAAHELSVSYVQDKTCVVCHEMKEPMLTSVYRVET